MTGLGQVVLRKGAGRDLALEHDVELVEAAAVGLGDEEEQEDAHDGGHAEEDPAEVAAEVGLVRVEQVGQDDGPDDAADARPRVADTDGLGAQARGRDLAGDGHGRADGRAVGDGGELQGDADGQQRGVGPRDHGADAHDEVHGAAETDAKEHEAAAAELHHEEDVEAGRHDTHGDAHLRQQENRVAVQARLVEEVGRVGRQHGAGHLRHVHADEDDHGAAQVGAAEALNVRGRVLDRLLVLDGRLDLVRAAGDVLVGARQLLQRDDGLVAAALHDQPVGRLGQERQADGENSGERPAGGEEDLVCHGVDDGDSGEGGGDGDQHAQVL